jgi:hypothetical protein
MIWISNNRVVCRVLGKKDTCGSRRHRVHGAVLFRPFYTGRRPSQYPSWSLSIHAINCYWAHDVLGDKLSTSSDIYPVVVRRVWRYQRGNHDLYIEEEQTTQWPNERVHKDKQRLTKHTCKTTDRVTRTPLKPGVSSSCPMLVCRIDQPGIVNIMHRE